MKGTLLIPDTSERGSLGTSMDIDAYLWDFVRRVCRFRE